MVLEGYNHIFIANIELFVFVWSLTLRKTEERIIMYRSKCILVNLKLWMFVEIDVTHTQTHKTEDKTPTKWKQYSNN